MIADLLLETMIGVDIASSHEALIYCVGSLKFLTGNATIAKQLVGKQCIEKLSTLLDTIVKLVSFFLFVCASLNLSTWDVDYVL